MPARVDHDARRKELLSRSFETFARDGYTACTMRGLAKSLGVSTGTLYHYFSGKEAVFEAMFRQLNDEIIASATEQLVSADTQKERLYVFVEFMGGHIEQLQNVVRIALEYYRHHPDPDSRAWLAGITREYTETFRKHLALDNAATARVTMSLILGAMVHQLLDSEGVDLLEHIHWIDVMTAQTEAPEAN
jgi:AcrR family transcriptional regulator